MKEPKYMKTISLFLPSFFFFWVRYIKMVFSIHEMVTKLGKRGEGLSKKPTST